MLGGAEVDDPWLHAALAQDRHGAGRGRDVVDVGGEHQRRDEEHVRDGLGVDILAGEVPAQAVVRLLGGDLERVGLLAGFEPAEAQHLERVLGGAGEPRSLLGDQPWRQIHTAAHPNTIAIPRKQEVEAMRMRAAVLEEFGKPLVIQELELDEPKDDEVLVRLVACGVCHTDLYTASGVDPSGYSPTVLGHEGAGVVEKVGSAVTLLAPGDHVVTLFSPQCGKCVHCVDERTNLCMAIREQQGKGYLPDGTTRLQRDGEEIRHFMGTSTFAEYTVMPEIALAKVNPEAPLEGAALFACGLSTGLGAAMNTAKVREGSTCVVFGAGMVGLGAVAGCRLQGAERIIAVDLSEDRLELAKGQGATETMIGGEGDGGEDPRRDRRLRRRLHLRGDRERQGHAPGGRVGADGLGPVHGRRGRRQGRDARRDPALPDHGPAGRGLVVRRRQGPRGGAEAGRPLARRRDRRRPVHLAPDHARRGQPRLRADGGPGRDPLGHRVRRR